MHKFVTLAAIAGALAGAGCAPRVVVVDPARPVYVAPRAVAVTPAPRAVVVAPAPAYVRRVCRWRTVRVVRPSGAVVFRRARVCR